MQDNMMEQHMNAFREEANELLAELESSLLELEESPTDSEIIGKVFRAMHTIKGSGAMFGFDNVAAFTHELETVYDLVRNGENDVTQHLIDLTLKGCDQIYKMVNGDEIDQERVEELVGLFQEMTSVKEDAEEETFGGDNTDASSQEVATYRIRFRPGTEIFTTGTNPLLLLDELRQMGKSEVIPHRGNIPELADLNPEYCYIGWDIILTTNAGSNAIMDVFIFVEDECDILIEIIDEPDDPDAREDYKRVGEILVERGDADAEDLNAAQKAQKKIGKVLVEAQKVDGDALESALIEQQHVKQIRQERKETNLASSIRVAADKLDLLVDLVGEMVTVQARLNQTAGKKRDPELTVIAEEVERLTAELRENIMSIRMVPIGTTFSRFKRLVRDLSKELGKEVALTTKGGETELDKTVIDKLSDPLVHIIRNCIDHGIECPDDRKKLGKSTQATVHLSALHSGPHVLISIEDDGTGLDVETIRTKAEEKGVISSDANLTESEIFSLIFAPGFSTAKTITDVSGRGVGMDVVKRSIESLRGTIEVNSKSGKGTTITLKLPLTLAIIDGFMVRVGEGYFVLPLSAVEECVEISGEEKENVRARNMMNVRGEIVPYQGFRDLFHINGTRPDIEKIVIVETGGQRIGFGVDYVVGQHQTVIKSLGDAYRDIEGLSGATIMGDGTVALIVDVPRLVQTAFNE